MNPWEKELRWIGGQEPREGHSRRSLIREPNVEPTKVHTEKQSTSNIYAAQREPSHLQQWLISIS